MKTRKNIGFIVYTEWIVLIVDYFKTLSINQIVSEFAMPCAISFVCTYLYHLNGKVISALSGLYSTLPTAISILIGFTIMFISILLSNDGTSVQRLKNTSSKHITLRKKTISVYQSLHIQFSYSLIIEIFTLLLVFFSQFCTGICKESILAGILLFLQVFFVLHLLFILTRGIVNIYFSFYNN